MQKTARRQLLRIASRNPDHRVALRQSVRLDGSLDLNRLIRIASYHPELQPYLLPIIREAANQPGRRKGKAEVSYLVWTMDAKDPNGGALIQKRPGVRGARKSIPAKWFMPVRDLKEMLKKVTDRKKRRALNVANKAGLAAVRKLYKAWFEKNWVTPWVKGEDEGYDYEPSAEDEDAFRLKAVNRVLGGIGSLKPSHKPTSRDLKRVKRLKAWLETGSQRRSDEEDQAEWEAEQKDGADDLRKKRREDYRKSDRYKERTKNTEWDIKEEKKEEETAASLMAVASDPDQAKGSEDATYVNFQSILDRFDDNEVDEIQRYQQSKASHWIDHSTVFTKGDFALIHTPAKAHYNRADRGFSEMGSWTSPAVYTIQHGFSLIASLTPGRKWKKGKAMMIQLIEEMSEAEKPKIIFLEREGYKGTNRGYSFEGMLLRDSMMENSDGSPRPVIGINKGEGFIQYPREEAYRIFEEHVAEKMRERKEADEDDGVEKDPALARSMIIGALSGKSESNAGGMSSRDEMTGAFEALSSGDRVELVLKSQHGTKTNIKVGTAVREGAAVRIEFQKGKFAMLTMDSPGFFTFDDGSGKKAPLLIDLEVVENKDNASSRKRDRVAAEIKRFDILEKNGAYTSPPKPAPMTGVTREYKLALQDFRTLSIEHALAGLVSDNDLTDIAISSGGFFPVDVGDPNQTDALASLYKVMSEDIPELVAEYSSKGRSESEDDEDVVPRSEASLVKWAGTLGYAVWSGDGKSKNGGARIKEKETGGRAAVSQWFASPKKFLKIKNIDDRNMIRGANSESGIEAKDIFDKWSDTHWSTQSQKLESMMSALEQSQSLGARRGMGKRALKRVVGALKKAQARMITERDRPRTKEEIDLANRKKEVIRRNYILNGEDTSAQSSSSADPMFEGEGEESNFSPDHHLIIPKRVYVLAEDEDRIEIGMGNVSAVVNKSDIKMSQGRHIVPTSVIDDVLGSEDPGSSKNRAFWMMALKRRMSEKRES